MNACRRDSKRANFKEMLFRVVKKISLAQEELKHEAIITRGSKSAIKEFRLLPCYETKNHVINVDWLNNRNKHSRNHNNESFKCYWCGGEGHKPA